MDESQRNYSEADDQKPKKLIRSSFWFSKPEKFVDDKVMR
jgi:hypothetical protein